MIKNLKKLRQLAGVTQQQLAERLTVSQQSVNKYENHNVEPDIDTLIKIADFFEVSLDYLVGRTEIQEMVTKKSMSDLSDRETQLLTLYAPLNQKQKDCVLTVIKSYR